MQGCRWTSGAMFWGIGLLLLQGTSAYGDESYGHRDSHGTAKMEHGGHMSPGWGGHFSGAGHYLRHLLRHQEAIGLTDEQVKRLKAIQLDLDKTRIRTEAEIMVAERELAGLVEDEKADLSGIETKLKHSENLGTTLRLAAIKAKRDAMGILNPDQRKKDRLEHDKMRHEHMGKARDRDRHHAARPNDTAGSQTP